MGVLDLTDPAEKKQPSRAIEVGLWRRASEQVTQAIRQESTKQTDKQHRKVWRTATYSFRVTVLFRPFTAACPTIPRNDWRKASTSSLGNVSLQGRVLDEHNIIANV